MTKMRGLLIIILASIAGLSLSGCGLWAAKIDVGRQIENLSLQAMRDHHRLIRLSDLQVAEWDEIRVYGPYSNVDGPHPNATLPPISPTLKARFARTGIHNNDGIAAVVIMRDGRAIDVGKVRRDHLDLTDVSRLTPLDCLRVEGDWPMARKVAC